MEVENVRQMVENQVSYHKRTLWLRYNQQIKSMLNC